MSSLLERSEVIYRKATHSPLAVFPSTPPTTIIPAAVKLSPIHTTTYYYYPSASARSIGPRYQYYITPARTPAKMPGRVVEFVPASNTICRPARDDERDVMQRFAAHASHCPRCKDPYRVYIEGGTLCERGHAHARDVAQYVYSKAGKAYSVIDRSATDARVQIEIPAKCDAIRGLLKAVDHGLKVRGPASRPVVTHDRTYHVPDRRPLPDRRDGYVMEVAARRKAEGGDRRREERWRAEGGDRRQPDRRDGNKPIEVAPRRREESRSTKGGDRRQEKDKKERSQRRKERDEPVIVYAESRRGKPYHC